VINDEPVEVESPNFEKFRRSRAAFGRQPTITIQKRGLISLSPSAVDRLGNPEAVTLLYDPDDQIVGVAAATPDDPDAFRLRRVGSRADGPRIISAASFTNYYDIDTSTSRRWDAGRVNGVLCISLRTPGTVVVGNRNGRTATGPRSPANDD